MQKIYVLRCENNKYYVGKTSDIDRRLAEHFDGRYGSEWTRYHKPEEVVEVKDMVGNHDEMSTTLEYMQRYGIDNVRGAQWSNRNLTEDQREAIRAAMYPDACYQCGEHGHFANNCPRRNQAFQTPRTMQCDRCGRTSHVERDCYATFDVDGDVLDCARCGRDSHSADNCYARSDRDGRRLY